MSEKRASNGQGARTFNVLQLMNQQAKRKQSPRALPASTVWDHAGAGVRGAYDSFPFDLGNNVPALFHAAGDWVGGHDPGAAFDRRIAAERARDRFDAANYGAARTAGQLAGIGLQVAALGGVGGAALAGQRIKQVTALLPKEVAAIVLAGGTSGVGQEAMLNQLSGRRGTLGDYAGAAMGGAATAATVMAGRPLMAGATGGATGSIAQDSFNGRSPSVDKARDAAISGRVLGAAGVRAGARHADGLPNRQKEAIGEAGSQIRTAIRGEKTRAGPKTREYLPGGGYTVPDQRTYRNGIPSEIVEAKFGRSAKLRPRQLQAFEQLSNYRVDHLLPRDFGAILAFPAAALGWAGAREVQQKKPPRSY